MSDPARTAVIVVTPPDYTHRYFAACAASLRVQTCPAACWTVFVVSNGTTASSTRLIREAAPEARIVESARNLGWGAGNNLAIRLALQDGFTRVVLLNVDTVVDRAWLAELVRAAEERPAVHIVQSTLLLHGTDRINSLGNRIQYLGYGFCQGYGRPDAAAPVPERIDYASGASMLVAREVFERVGLFRDDFFMYYDDVEFCWRARLAGFRVGLARRSVCHHKYTFGTTTGWLYYLHRNRLLTLFTMERLPTLCLIAPCLVAAEVVVGIYYVARGWGRTACRLLAYFLRPRTWRAIAERRRTIRALRRVRDAEIVKPFAGVIVFAEIRHPLLRYLFNPLLALYWLIVRRLIAW